MLIAGVDEAGRGPLAGPVVAAAVVFEVDRPISGLADSKVLSPARREHFEGVVKHRALSWAVSRADVNEIDRLNILGASLLAMQRAVEALNVSVDLVLVDGNQAPSLRCAVETVIRGDATVPVIAAASILAKVARDREMCTFDTELPGYGFARHKGYPTAFHLLALEIFGASPIHRQSFAPVRRRLASST